MKKRASFEAVARTERASWHAFTCRGPFGYAWHYHPEVELVVITAGCGIRFVGDSVGPIVAGDLFLLGPSLPHAFVAGAEAEAVCAQFPPAMIGGWLALPEFAAVSGLLNRCGRGLHARLDAVEPWRDLVAGDGAQRTLALLRLLVELATRADMEPIAGKGFMPLCDGTTQRRLEAMVRHLADRLDGRVSLTEIARVAHLTPSAASRFFRQMTGQTITDYLTRLRVAAACRALTDPGHSDVLVSVVASECGFTNLTHFNRQFRRITGMTPRAFRARGGLPAPG